MRPGVAVQPGCIVGDPFHRGAALLDDGVESHGRGQCVVERDGGGARGDEAFGGKRVHVLVHGAPVAAVDEDLNRRGAGRCRKQVGGHVGARAIADVEGAGEGLAHSARSRTPKPRCSPGNQGGADASCSRPPGAGPSVRSSARSPGFGRCRHSSCGTPKGMLSRPPPALSRAPPPVRPPDRAGGAPRSARAFASASGAHVPRSARAGTRFRLPLRCRLRFRRRRPAARSRSG